MRDYKEYRRERDSFELAMSADVRRLQRAQHTDEAAAGNDINLLEIKRRNAKLPLPLAESATSRQRARAELVKSGGSLQETESAWRKKVSQVPGWRRVIWGARYSLAARARPRK